MIKLTLLRQLLQRNWYQMYWVSFPLEHTSNAERGILTHGQPRFSISSAQACTLERILQRHIMVVVGTATPELVFTATTDAAKWVQIYGLLRPTDANDEYANDKQLWNLSIAVHKLPAR